MAAWYLYVLECRGGKLYSGITTDVERRFAEHRQGRGAAYTRMNPPLRILAATTCANRAEATRDELSLKRLTKGEKMEWVQTHPWPPQPAAAPCHEEKPMTDPEKLFKRIDHVELVPGDLERSLRFYQDVLGFRLKNRAPVGRPPMKEVIYLTLGDTMLEVIDAERPDAKHPSPWHVGWRGLALEVPSMAEALAYLAAKGISPSREPSDLGTSIRAEIEDPDGLMIELREWKK